MLAFYPNECLADSGETTKRIQDLQEQNLILSMWLRSVYMGVTLTIFALFLFAFIVNVIRSRRRNRECEMHEKMCVILIPK